MTRLLVNFRPLYATQTGFHRPQIGSGMLSAVVALYLIFFTNRTFWAKIHTYVAGDPLAVITLYAVLSLLFIAVVTIFSAKYLIKPAFIVLIVAGGVGAWFTDRFGVVIDSDMIRNAVETTPAEAHHLITPDFLVHMLATVVLPIVLLAWVRIDHRPIVKKLMWNTTVITACLLGATALGYTHSKTYVTAIRQHKDLVKSLNPVTPIGGTIAYLQQTEGEAAHLVQPLGLDAKVMPSVNGLRKPRVTIIVAGETARAANFSLGGYGRDTNPELARRDITYFPGTTSCGTATATSIPCMFSPFARATYSHSKGIENETLMDVLAHAGVNVAWWDNNTGSKHVADRIPYVDLASSTDPRFCSMGECQDGLFLDRLDSWLDHVTGDSVLVLHQLGSHGPTYYLRYPEAFRRFTPDCRTAELSTCKDEEIVNAYDNSLLYTDHVLATVIDKLAARSDRLAGGMIYMSDHGESLGENGLYLHGTPYMFAPDVQTHVPFLVWLGQDFAASMGLDKACLAGTVGEQHSHDNLFDSVLGMMNVATKVYDPSLDVFAACRNAPTS